MTQNLAGHRVDGDRQCLHRAGVEVGNHEVINRVGQADEECRQNGRGQLRHDDFGESLARCAAQIQRCIVQAGIELAQLGAYIKDNIRDIEGDVRNQQRRPAEDAALAADAEVLRHDEEKHQ